MTSMIDRFLGNRTMEKQSNVHCGEVFQLWTQLVMRYDVHELTDIFQNYAHDIEFKAILSLGLNIMDEEIAEWEKVMDNLGIALPPRPPKSINTPGNTEVLRDELMFRTIYMGIQNFMSEHLRNIRMMQNTKLREMSIRMERKEVDLFVKMSDYGRLKGWLFIPPAYNPDQG